MLQNNYCQLHLHMLYNFLKLCKIKARSSRCGNRVGIPKLVQKIAVKLLESAVRSLLNFLEVPLFSRRKGCGSACVCMLVWEAQ